MTIDLQRGRFLRVLDGAGSTVTLHAGEVWITEQGNPRDVVLRAGHSMRLGRRGLALLEAFSDASISLQP
jgi:ferric-dicitrate binding protein FerR (iron transport regulator)